MQYTKTFGAQKSEPLPYKGFTNLGVGSGGSFALYSDELHSNLILLIYRGNLGKEADIYVSIRVKPILLLRFLYGEFDAGTLLKVHNEPHYYIHYAPREFDYDDIELYPELLQNYLGAALNIVTELDEFVIWNEWDDYEGAEANTQLIRLVKNRFDLQYDRNPDYEYDYSGLGLDTFHIPCKYKDLNSINYSNNKLTELPEWISKCYMIHRLNISGNPIPLGKIRDYENKLFRATNLKEFIFDKIVNR